MPYEFKLPDLGEGITEGEVRRWLISEGEMVSEHQTVVEIETDKAVVELPAPHAGRVSRIAMKEGDVAKVGEVLMIIAEPEESPTTRQKSVSVVGTLPEAEEEGVTLATPAVRRRARELGLSLVKVSGSGPRGSITLDDVEKAGPRQGLSWTVMVAWKESLCAGCVGRLHATWSRLILPLPLSPAGMKLT
jgi:pyruvate dehydrogenase E2 component (dihydrolipoamide acetyltransferase)